VIDNPVLLRFCDETVRPVADRLAGLLPLLDAVADAATGQGLAAVLGTTDSALFRGADEPWGPEDYGATGAPQAVTGSDAGGRTLLTTYDVIAFLRVMAALKGMRAANPALGPLIGKLAVNPRA
jgi:hypothetical protein